MHNHIVVIVVVVVVAVVVVMIIDDDGNFLPKSTRASFQFAASEPSAFRAHCIQPRKSGFRYIDLSARAHINLFFYIRTHETKIMDTHRRVFRERIISVKQEISAAKGPYYIILENGNRGLAFNENPKKTTFLSMVLAMLETNMNNHGPIRHENPVLYDSIFVHMMVPFLADTYVDAICNCSKPILDGLCGVAGCRRLKIGEYLWCCVHHGHDIRGKCCIKCNATAEFIVAHK